MAKNKKKNKGVNKDIIFIIIILIAALLFISNLGLGGFLGQIISSFMFGIMGFVSYIFPFYLIFVCLYFLKDSKHPVKNIIITTSIYILLCLSFELFSITKTSHINNPVDAFVYSRESHRGGGFFGGIFSFIFSEAFGLVGAYIIDIICILILVAYFRRKSIINAFLDRDPKLSQEKRDAKRAKRLEKREEQKQKKAKEEEERKKRAEEENSIITGEQEVVKEPPIPRIDKNVRGVDFVTVGENLENIVPKDMPEVNPNELIEVFEDAPMDVSEELPVIEKAPSEVNHIILKPVEGHEDIVPIPLPEPVLVEPELTQIALEPEPIAVDAEPELPDFDISALEPEEELPKIVLEPEPEPEPELPEIVIDPEPEPEPELPDFDISALEPEEELPKIVLEPESQSELPEIVIDSKPEPEPELPEIVIDPEPEPELQDIAIEPESVADSQEPEEPVKEYILPPVSLLKRGDNKTSESDDNLNETADKLVNTLNNFGVEVTISEISRGPAVTRFELIPSMGVKVSKIINLSDDIKLNLAAADIRIEAPIPGKSAVGIEVPNKVVDMVHFGDLIDSNAFKDTASPIAFGAGKDLGGNIVISDIAKMPHVLIAGATGSGKSVCINTIIMSILYKAKPDEVKFIMIDPKVVELSVYNGIPHLLIPVVSDPKKAAGALNWAVREMNDRYQKFAMVGVRDMAGYNKKIALPDFDNESGIHKKLPQIVVIVDELADLMMVSSSEVEESICRLAQLARAAGIHLVIATQRPSVNVITGLIKANMPSRIAFAVTSGVDSKTILDKNGAEKLLGKGDMLYFPQGYSKPIRVQGAFVSDDEVTAVVDFIKSENSHTGADIKIKEEIEKQLTENNNSAMQSASGAPADDGRDEYFAVAGRLIIEKEKGSIGMLQRNFKIGFNRAARIMDQLTEAGVVGPEEGTKPRKVLVTIEEFEEIINEG